MSVGPATSHRASALTQLLSEPIVVADVGCRWGFADAWERLGEGCLNIGFDPDEDECERLRGLYADRPNVRLVPAGLGEVAGSVLLYRTRDPGGNSLFHTVDDVIERHPALSGGEVVSTETVNVITFDDWCEAEGIDRVDVIKIDTQGSELSVLRGAQRMLDSVRAIEVEVEFNELYDDIPLFGEIDRFLRDRGFVLWKFRDLAHYSQRGAPTDRHVEETIYYDSEVARYAAGSGQLFWANAFYLRRSVAYPSADAGWETLARNACVTSALRFHDLVVLSLDRAKSSAPENVKRVIDSVLSDDLVSAQRELDLATRSTTLDGTFRVDVGSPDFEGWGWRPLQLVEIGPVRWTGPAREAWVDLPLRLPPGSRVDLLLIGGMSEEILGGLTLEVNRVPVELTRTPHEAGILYSATLSADYSSDRAFTRLVLRTVDTIPWNQVHTDSPDDAELGIALSWLEVTSPEPSPPPGGLRTLPDRLRQWSGRPASQRTISSSDSAT